MDTDKRVSLSPEDRVRLEGWVADRNTPQKLVWRARIVLMWADAASLASIVQTLGSCGRWARPRTDGGWLGIAELLPAQEPAHQRRDLVSLLVQREVPGAPPTLRIRAVAAAKRGFVFMPVVSFRLREVGPVNSPARAPGVRVTTLGQPTPGAVPVLAPSRPACRRYRR